ncbi:MAG: hydantoinase/oxoprolinase N-terminal domain-containing protein, partial [Acidobacteriota bacterium]|nr:hydantoinase/oxoprolinase N-terminal domain-containing protein [Acidobacteriota bacterium]
MNVSQGVWNIWIDTGGTFTDCIAVDPTGLTHRCKVLSNGSLRDRVDRVGDDGTIHLRNAASLPSGFLTGFKMSVLGSGRDVDVVDHDGATGAINASGGVVPGL